MKKGCGIIEEVASRRKPEGPQEGMTCEVSGDTQALNVVSTTIRTLDDAIRAAKVDMSVWAVDRFVVNKWDQGAKLGIRGSERIAVTPLYQIKAWFRRKVSKGLEDGIGELIRRMEKHSPKYQKLTTKKISDPHLLEISINDIHFAKLAWSREVDGPAYDLSIAETLYTQAVKALAARSSGFNIEKIILPVGNDFFHVDGPGNITANGTPQDTDGRYCKLFEVGQMAVVKAIDYLQSIAPLEVIWVGGNHDRLSSWHLVHTIKAWFRNCNRVSVNDEPTQRKYVHYGVTALGYTHGDEESHGSLPGIMASERPEIWAASKYREFHLGHFHKRKETRHVSTDTHEGVVVRVLPSLSSRDAWHVRKGYIGTRAADAFLYSKANGPAGYFIANVDGERRIAA